MITEAEDFFTLGCGRCPRFATPGCVTRQWAAGLAQLRLLCRAAGLDETVKWAHPCYQHAGRNIALITAFRDDFRLSFMNPALMTDPSGVLEKNGPNTRHAGMMRFTRNAQVKERERVIRAYLQEAVGYAEAGIKPEKTEYDIDLPRELLDAMDSDPELAEAFWELTPGRQRSYAFNLNAAKTSATRISRIAKFRPLILAGKGALDR
jgi:uncharacterized protein YdeI (YjbR/CyaY-like superfamily)